MNNSGKSTPIRVARPKIAPSDPTRETMFMAERSNSTGHNKPTSRRETAPESDTKQSLSLIHHKVPRRKLFPPLLSCCSHRALVQVC